MTHQQINKATPARHIRDMLRHCIPAQDIKPSHPPLTPSRHPTHPTQAQQPRSHPPQTSTYRNPHDDWHSQQRPQSPPATRPVFFAPPCGCRPDRVECVCASARGCGAVDPVAHGRNELDGTVMKSDGGMVGRRIGWLVRRVSWSARW